jgi:hypothetical protein
LPGAGMAWGPGTLLILPIGSKHCPDLTFWIKGRELLLRSDRTCFPGSELISVAGKGPNATPPHEAERSLTIDQRQSTVPQQRLWENGRRLCFARYKWSQGRPTSMKPGRMALLASVGCARTASLSYLRHCREHQISHSAALATRTQQFSENGSDKWWWAFLCRFSRVSRSEWRAELATLHCGQPSSWY